MLLYYSLLVYWGLCSVYPIFLLLTFFFNISPIRYFSQLSKYGKTLPSSDNKGVFMISKRFFLYIYVIAVFTYISLWIYLLTGHTINLRAYSYPNFLPPNTALYVFCLSTIQPCRRLYECLFVSRFSEHAMMHISFAILGGTYYSTIAMSILASSEEMSLHFIPIEFFLSPNVIIGTALFFYVSYHQHVCHRILANLRAPGAKTASSKYSIPYGGWFKLLSAPHYIADMLVYVAYLIITKGAGSLIWGVNLYTTAAMLYCAVTSHHWYKEKFKNYPKNRKSVIPFIY